MNTTKYKTIISVLNATDAGFNEYIELSKRIDLFVQTDGASEKGGGLDMNCLGEFAVLQERLYKLALEKKKNDSC